jgi:tellurite methyltransferase
MPDFDREKWNLRYSSPARAAEIPQHPSAVLVALAEHLPRRGRALDLAGGAGRHAVWLAQRGLEVTNADISSAGLSLTRERAALAGVSLHCLQTDLEESGCPAGPWDLIVSVCFLPRVFFPSLIAELAPAGTLVIIQPTKKNLEQHQKPPAEFLLAEGELLALAAGLEIVQYQEGWSLDQRHDAVLVGRKSKPLFR